MTTNDRTLPSQGLRRNIFLGIVTLVVVVFAARLVQLQLIEGSQYRLKTEAQGIKRVTIEPIRGSVFDRNGVIMVASEAAYSVHVTPNKLTDGSKAILAHIMQADTAEINARIARYKISDFSPVRIFRDINDTVWAKLNEFYTRLPGVELVDESKRYYDDRVHASHILGYTGEINQKEMDRLGDYYIPGDLVGKSGVENAFEVYLRGEKGYEFVAVNNRGQRVSSFNDGKNDLPPFNGFDLYLGLDAELQAYAEYLLQGYHGAVVALDPSTGEIIAMASAPDFDLNVFNGVTKYKDYKALNDDPGKPLLNRATQAVYPPGSTWKMLMAIAGLNEGLITPSTTITCPGSFSLGGNSWKCHGAHGSVNARKAVHVSCNVFFYKLALKMGIDTYNKYGKLFHFGERLGVDVPEGRTLLPSREYYDTHFGKDKWPKGVLVNLGIGQGELLVNPLQLAAYVAAIGNGGVWNQPHLVSRVKNKRLGDIERVDYVSEDLGIPKDIIDIVKAGMFDVVNTAGGTARGARLDTIKVAGKTGTAQAPGGKKDHSWFVSFAPYDNPKIAMCVLVENIGFGGTYAAPMTRKLINFYLTRTIDPADNFRFNKDSTSTGRRTPRSTDDDERQQPTPETPIAATTRRR